MKSILLAIFVVGMSISPLARYRNLYFIALDCPEVLQPNQACSTAVITDAGPFEIFIGRIHIIDNSALCPWWIDPELWWNQSCTGGLPPRLPVPSGLK